MKKYYLSRGHTAIHIVDGEHKDDLLFQDSLLAEIETDNLQELIKIFGREDEVCDCVNNLGLEKCQTE